MTIEEAIKHCEEVAEELEKRVKPYQCESINKKLYEVNKEKWDSCIECASEHRQLAEWLRELKEYRKDIKEIKKWINSDNRGNADYFIVDKIEEIIGEYEDDE